MYNQRRRSIQVVGKKVCVKVKKKKEAKTQTTFSSSNTQFSINPTSCQYQLWEDYITMHHLKLDKKRFRKLSMDLLLTEQTYSQHIPLGMQTLMSSTIGAY